MTCVDEEDLDFGIDKDEYFEDFEYNNEEYWREIFLDEYSLDDEEYMDKSS